MQTIITIGIVQAIVTLLLFITGKRKRQGELLVLLVLLIIAQLYISMAQFMGIPLGTNTVVARYLEVGMK